MCSGGFVVETADGDREFPASGAAARYLLASGYANAEREPEWHLRWCLDRLERGDSFDVGAARVLRG